MCVGGWWMESRKEEHQALAEGGGTETRSGACYGGGGGLLSPQNLARDLKACKWSVWNSKACSLILKAVCLNHGLYGKDFLSSQCATVLSMHFLEFSQWTV